MNKLDMAHDYMVAWMQSGNSEIIDANELASFFFSVADAMQAEADKREPKGFPDALKEDEKCLHYHYSMNTNKCLDCGEVLKMADSTQLDWQPDWSVAPDDAEEWKMIGEIEAVWVSYHNGEYYLEDAPSFNYQGDWKQSLRKRPQ